MKRGLKLWSVNTDNYLYDAVKLYESNVFDYIELYVVINSLDQSNKWKIVKKNHKIPFIIHCPHFAHGFNLAKPEKKESNLKIYQEVKEYADELDAEYIIFHGGIDGNIEETAKQLASFNEQRALIENKPYVALPNRMGGKFCRGYNIDEIKLVQKAAKCGFCFDFGHAICAANSQFDMTNIDNHSPQPSPARGEGVEHRLNFIYSYLDNFVKLNPQMFHLTDIEDITSPYDSHPHLGQGQLDFEKIFKMIPADAFVTFETVKNSKENLDDFCLDMEFLKKYQTS